MAIVPAQYVPRSNFFTFAEGPLAGAATGAGESVLAGVAAGGITAAMMPAAAAYAAPVLIVGLTISTAVTAVVVGVHGARRAVAVPAEKAQQIKSVIAEAVARLDAQRALAKRLTAEVQENDWVRLQAVEAAGPTAPGERPGYEPLRAAGVDTALEIGVPAIGFDGCGKGFTQPRCSGGSEKPLVFLFMIGRARLVRVTDGAELYASDFRYDSPPRELAEWAASDAKVFAEELELGYRDLADRMNDELLMVTPIALPVPSYWLPPGDPLYLVCWLHPIYPEVKLKSLPEILREARAQAGGPWGAPPIGLTPLSFTVLDSRSPTLRWTAFPRDIDRGKLDPVILGKIGDVTYDLRIWEVAGYTRGKIAYERTGLHEPLHQLESLLKPDQRYFWTFRARFRYDGQPMVTRWAFLRVGSCDRDLIPADTYYRFVTPQ